MDPTSDRTARLRLVAAALLAPLAAGWLASGSCTVAACYEECDPCVQVCKCSHVCHGLVAGDTGLRIVAYAARVLTGGDDRFVHVLDVAVGPSLESTPDAGPERLAEFARDVLEVNAGLFTAEREPRWRLDAVQAFPGRTVLQFELESVRAAPHGSNSVSLLFDARGRLLEATHVVDRGSE